MKRYRAILGPVAVVLLFVAGMWCSPFEPHRPPVGATDERPGSPPDTVDSTAEETDSAIGAAQSAAERSPTARIS